MAERVKSKKKRSTAKGKTPRPGPGKRGDNSSKFNAGDGNVPDDTYEIHIKKLNTHNNKIAKMEEELRQAKSERSNAYKLAKKDGCNTDAMKEAFKLHKLDHNVVVMDTHDIGRVLKIMGSPLALEHELFQDIDVPKTIVAARAGHEAGKTGLPRDANPNKAGSEEFVEWDREWVRGEKELIEQFGGKRPDTKDPTKKKEDAEKVISCLSA